MSFTTSSFVGKLAKLSDSQQSIQTLSHWVQYHKSSCNESAVTWAQECLRAPPARHLLYVYLANDIMQNSKRKGNEFCDAYGAQLPAVLPKMYAGASEEVKSKMLKVVHIWEERRVLDSSLLNELYARMTGAPTAAPAPPRSRPPPPPGRSASSASQPPPPAAAAAAYSAAPPSALMSIDPLADDDDGAGELRRPPFAARARGLSLLPPHPRAQALRAALPVRVTDGRTALVHASARHGARPSPELSALNAGTLHGPIFTASQGEIRDRPTTLPAHGLPG